MRSIRGMSFLVCLLMVGETLAVPLREGQTGRGQPNSSILRGNTAHSSTGVSQSPGQRPIAKVRAAVVLTSQFIKQGGLGVLLNPHLSLTGSLGLSTLGKVVVDSAHAFYGARNVAWNVVRSGAGFLKNARHIEKGQDGTFHFYDGKGREFGRIAFGATTLSTPSWMEGGVRSVSGKSIVVRDLRYSNDLVGRKNFLLKTGREGHHSVIQTGVTLNTNGINGDGDKAGEASVRIEKIIDPKFKPSLTEKPFHFRTEVVTRRGFRGRTEGQVEVIDTRVAGTGPSHMERSLVYQVGRGGKMQPLHDDLNQLDARYAPQNRKQLAPAAIQ